MALCFPFPGDLCLVGTSGAELDIGSESLCFPVVDLDWPRQLTSSWVTAVLACRGAGELANGSEESTDGAVFVDRIGLLERAAGELTNGFGEDGGIGASPVWSRADEG